MRKMIMLIQFVTAYKRNIISSNPALTLLYTTFVSHFIDGRRQRRLRLGPLACSVLILGSEERMHSPA